MKFIKLFSCSFVLLLIFSFQTAICQPANGRSRVYELLKAGTIDGIKQELIELQDSQWKQKTGYEGALLMKQAGLLKIPKKKLSSFKAGRIKLETAIAADPSDAELHFLRLIIGEHAPGIVKYKANLAADKEIVIKHHKEMSDAAQEALADYVKTSKILHQSDL